MNKINAAIFDGRRVQIIIKKKNTEIYIICIKWVIFIELTENMNEIKETFKLNYAIVINYDL